MKNGSNGDFVYLDEVSQLSEDHTQGDNYSDYFADECFYCGYCHYCHWFRLSASEQKEQRVLRDQRRRERLERQRKLSREVTSELIELLKQRDVSTFFTKFHQNFVHIDHNDLTEFFWERPDYVMFEKLVSRGIRICRPSSQLPPLAWIVNLFSGMFERGLIKAQWFVFTDYFFDQRNYLAASEYTIRLLILAIEAGETELVLALLRASSFDEILTHRIYKLFLRQHKFIETGDSPTKQISKFLLDLFPAQVAEIGRFVENECHGMDQERDEAVEEIIPKKEHKVKRVKIPKGKVEKAYGKVSQPNFARSIREDYELYNEDY